MSLTVEKLVRSDDGMLDTMTEWMYHWWGKDEGHSREEIRCYMEHGMQGDRLPQTYGMFLDGTLIGMYQFRLDDLFARPDLYPWLANVYLEPAYRSRGYGAVLMEKIRSTAGESLPFRELYLYTTHAGLYERYGWEFVSEIDTFLKHNRVQRLYRLDLQKRDDLTVGDSLEGHAVVQRIQQMEAYFDALEVAAGTHPDSIREDEELRDMLQALIQYYESGEWLKDYERDERGELPAELKRGVLSQDALYHLLCELEQREDP